MSKQILITGASGFCGSALIQHIIDEKSIPLSNLHAVIRSSKAAGKLRALGVNVVHASLTEDAEKVTKAVIDLNIDIVVDFANSTDYKTAKPLMDGLAELKKKSGKQVHFIHTSGTTSFSTWPASGWDGGIPTDTAENLYELERKAPPYFARDTTMKILDNAEELGITAYIVLPSGVYGTSKASFASHPISVQWPSMIKEAISSGRLHTIEGSDDYIWPMLHVDDNTTLFHSLIAKILRDENPGSGKKHGFYIGVSHNLRLGEAARGLAKALFEKGLVGSAEVEYWTAEQAARAFGWPEAMTSMIWGSEMEVTAERAKRDLGWEPKWTREALIERGFKEDVEGVLALEKAKEEGRV